MEGPREEAINSQVVEQANSQLKKLRSQLSYMGIEAFMTHAILFMRHLNLKKKDKI